MKPRTLILRTAGVNCDAETAHAFELAGSTSESIHVNRLLENPSLLADFQIIAIPGGFSYGDDIAAGRIFANQIAHHLHDAFHDFRDAGKPIIGICDGFHVLVKTDLHPGGAVSPLQHPPWMKLAKLPGEGGGLRVFRTAVGHVRDAAGAGVWNYR